MGIIEKISKSLGLNKDMNIDEYMDTVELDDVDALHQPADFYVKPIALESESDVPVILEELKNKNIVLLNVSPMSKQTSKLKSVIDTIKSYVVKINGDIARIDESKILLTPSKVKIVKSKSRR